MRLEVTGLNVISRNVGPHSLTIETQKICILLNLCMAIILAIFSPISILKSVAGRGI